MAAALDVFDFDSFTTLGKILVRRGVLTERQLARALEEQGRRRNSPLGDLLVELRLCDREEINEAIHEQDLARLPPETHKATHAAQETLRVAFAKVEREADRLTARRRDSGVLVLPISPDES